MMHDTKDNICKEGRPIVGLALIMIPDISGFTRLVNQTEISHSQIIIAQLLETLLQHTILNLKVSEIEGDAILFYVFNDPPPPLEEVIEQCKIMFQSFHRKLKTFSRKTGCRCGACSTLRELTLKFIIHYGELGSVMVGDYCKLFGINLIIAHRLLKNEIPLREYVLFTDKFLNCYKHTDLQNYIDWARVNNGKAAYDHIGNVSYQYASLKPLLDHSQIENN